MRRTGRRGSPSRRAGRRRVPRSRRAASADPGRGPRGSGVRACARARRTRGRRRGRDPDQAEHEPELDLAGRRHHAAEHDRRLGPGDEADERAGLEEGEAARRAVRSGAERLGEVGQAPPHSPQLDGADVVSTEPREREPGDRGSSAGGRRVMPLRPRAGARRGAERGDVGLRREHRLRPPSRAPAHRRPRAPAGHRSTQCRRGRRRSARDPDRDGAVGEYGDDRGSASTPNASSNATRPPLAAPRTGTVLATWPRSRRARRPGTRAARRTR